MKKNSASTQGMTLVEVALAIGLLSFCAVALMGLLPIMLNVSRESRETAIVARIYKAVVTDLQEDPQAASGAWYFNSRGVLLPSAQDSDYRATTSGLQPSSISGSANPKIRMAQLIVENIHRGDTNLVRPIFLNRETNSTR